MDVEELQRAQLDYLMSVIQIEMNMEASRSARLDRVVYPDERRQLEGLFATQREASQARIRLIKLDHDKVLKEKVERMGAKLKTAKKETAKKGGKP